LNATGAIIALAPIVIGLLAVSAVFSAAETALTGASRSRMHQMEREGDRSAGRVNKLLSDQETMIGAVLLGNNLINILASALTTQVLTQAIPGAWGVAAATGVMTVLVLVFAEVLPKTLAILRSCRLQPCWSFRFLGRLFMQFNGLCVTLCAFSASSWIWKWTCWRHTKRFAARSNITIRRVLLNRVTGACSAAFWIFRRWM